MLISNRYVLLKRFYRILTYLHIYVNEAQVYQGNAPWCQLKLFRIILIVNCFCTCHAILCHLLELVFIKLNYLPSQISDPTPSTIKFITSLN